MGSFLLTKGAGAAIEDTGRADLLADKERVPAEAEQLAASTVGHAPYAVSKHGVIGLTKYTDTAHVVRVTDGN